MQDRQLIDDRLARQREPRRDDARGRDGTTAPRTRALRRWCGASHGASRASARGRGSRAARRPDICSTERGTRTTGRRTPTVAGPSRSSEIITAASTPIDAVEVAVLIERCGRRARRCATIDRRRSRPRPSHSQPQRRFRPPGSAMDDGRGVDAARASSDAPACVADSDAVTTAR